MEAGMEPGTAEEASISNAQAAMAAADEESDEDLTYNSQGKPMPRTKSS